MNTQEELRSLGNHLIVRPEHATMADLARAIGLISVAVAEQTSQVVRPISELKRPMYKEQIT